MQLRARDDELEKQEKGNASHTTTQCLDDAHSSQSAPFRVRSVSVPKPSINTAEAVYVTVSSGRSSS